MKVVVHHNTVLNPLFLIYLCIKEHFSHVNMSFWSCIHFMLRLLGVLPFVFPCRTVNTVIMTTNIQVWFTIHLLFFFKWNSKIGKTTSFWICWADYTSLDDILCIISPNVKCQNVSHSAADTQPVSCFLLWIGTFFIYFVVHFFIYLIL